MTSHAGGGGGGCGVGAGTGAGGGPDGRRSAAVVAACGYWRRRGMETGPGQVAVAPGAPLLLLAVLAAAGGGTVLTPRPCEEWYGRQARLLGRTVHTVPVPVECGGVPDPVALRETARREREGGEAPAVLVLSVADDCTGTAVPPELLLEVTEVAGDEGLLIVSDETWRETAHVPHTTVVVSPAEMAHAEAPGEGRAAGESGREGGRGRDGTGGPAVGPSEGRTEMKGLPESRTESRAGEVAVVLADLRATLLPQGPAAGIARFPDSNRGCALATDVRKILAALHTGLGGPDDTAVADALTEPQPLRTRRTAAAQSHGTLLAGLHRALTEAGALCRPPKVGRHLYADFEPVRPRLAERGITDAASLEAYLVREFGPFACGGHRLGDDPKTLRVRLSATLATGGTPPGPSTAQDAPLRLATVGATLTGLTGAREQTGS